MSIVPLPLEVVNLIAAGEVIDSYSAVVRELVENSLDAGATRLVIALFPDLWRVQLCDNGTGMGLTDLHHCARPHSTSKIHTLDDLWQITSLGFRGEALHSIAQVAQLEIASLSTTEETGWQIRYTAQGEAETMTPIALAPGTRITVSDLFAKMPVRRMGLPSLSQQLKSVQTLIYHVALCHPHITWQIWQNDRPWFNISGSTTAQFILPQFLKQVKTTDLQYISQTIPPAPHQNLPTSARLELVLGLPDRVSRHRPDWIKVAVNGRVVRSPQLEQTLTTGLARTLPRDRFPVCFLHLHLCPSHIDWNRHPAKAEIYLHSLDFWREQVANAIEQALRLNAVTLPVAVQNQRVTQLLKASEEKGRYQVKGIENSPKSLQKEAIGLMSLKAVAQVRKMYIVTEHDTGLWLIEQHIAHERVIYERLQDNWQLVDLEPPIILNDLKPFQVEQLERLQLNIELFGEKIWAVRQAPEPLAQRDDCKDALLELSLGGDIQTAQVATACRSAIRNGTPLNLDEMQVLIDQWQNTRNPHTCPHGRPIYLSLEESSLSRFFRRHWVIGKSHGI